MFKKTFSSIAVLLLFLTSIKADNVTFLMSDFGVTPNSSQNLSKSIDNALRSIKSKVKSKDHVQIIFDKGTYLLSEEGSVSKELFISNHDQVNPKNIGLFLDGWTNLTIDGRGAEFVFDGTMLPIVLQNSKAVTLKDFSIDFKNPHIAQVEVMENRGEDGIVFRAEPWVQGRISEKGQFQPYGLNWSQQVYTGIAFEKGSRHILYKTSDLNVNLDNSLQLRADTYYAPKWKDYRLKEGTIVALRNYYRPTPGIFLDNNINTKLNNVIVHYAQGMGLLAQLCENIELDGFSVRLKGADDPRYFTTQADATHFSSCKGNLISINGYYEGMMDDAINVHGTYLKVIKQIDSKTIVGQYMHPQAYGFEWGRVGDNVTFVKSNTMEYVGKNNKVVSIKPYDKETVEGAKQYLIELKSNVEFDLDNNAYGIENLTWTPKVVFKENLIRNNRARGALFSTPQPVLVENNIFDHTSGSAILLCGDCNGWYETGACRNVVIKNNLFINSLTSLFQFTNAIISIYPEIPNLKDQEKYFHGGAKDAIIIEDNTFITFDEPIVYAKSVDGLVIKNNTIVKNEDFKPFHWNNELFKFERVVNHQITNNKIIK